jgi:hypothetical protein
MDVKLERMVGAIEAVGTRVVDAIQSQTKIWEKTLDRDCPLLKQDEQK